MKAENLKKLQKAVATIEALLPELKAILREEGQAGAISSCNSVLAGMDLLTFVHEQKGSTRLIRAIRRNFYDGFYNRRKFQEDDKANVREKFPIGDFVTQFRQYDVKRNAWQMGTTSVVELRDLLERFGIEWK